MHTTLQTNPDYFRDTTHTGTPTTYDMVTIDFYEPLTEADTRQLANTIDHEINPHPWNDYDIDTYAGQIAITSGNAYEPINEATYYDLSDDLKQVLATHGYHHEHHYDINTHE